MTDIKHSEELENWCYRAETTRLLGLSIAQIHMSLTEGDNSINTLTNSFQELATICSKVEGLTHSAESQSEDALALVSKEAESMSSHVDAAIVAFQFYDRLCQRLEHVAASLEGLSDLLQETENENPADWRRLREHIRAHYTMKEEHLMYETIMQGATAKEALEIFRARLAEKPEEDDGDIELF
ncbi:hypothetical protein HR060_11195 [Catenovulum sp. SM1970]|uniref:hypothetical protein n=1 Tax=Marinifaba aquimaris TaxID=2741323 RepID=UPI001571956C|nr:hypothetical protein [Marinifaba aquimaris]NTS77426.1 hypothetical protein [Marinifaba aquimaris]